MSLLEFARGPALEIAFAVFAFGVAWRLLSLLALPWSRDRAAARGAPPPALVPAVAGVPRRLWAAPPFRRSDLWVTLNSYVYHIGLAVIVFGLAQHIQFIKGLFGLHWPNLPTGLVSLVSVLTLASLTVALARRVVSPVLRLISTANDYFSWFVTALPVATGLLAQSHLGARYETLLALHLLSVALLLAWFPFGKLMHAFLVFLTRSETAIFYRRRGVQM